MCWQVLKVRLGSTATLLILFNCARFLDLSKSLSINAKMYTFILFLINSLILLLFLFGIILYLCVAVCTLHQFKCICEIKCNKTWKSSELLLCLNCVCWILSKLLTDLVIVWWVIIHLTSSNCMKERTKVFVHNHSNYISKIKHWWK